MAQPGSACSTRFVRRTSAVRLERGSCAVPGRTRSAAPPARTDRNTAASPARIVAERVAASPIRPVATTSAFPRAPAAFPKPGLALKWARYVVQRRAERIWASGRPVAAGHAAVGRAAMGSVAPPGEAVAEDNAAPVLVARRRESAVRPAEAVATMNVARDRVALRRVNAVPPVEAVATIYVAPDRAARELVARVERHVVEPGAVPRERTAARRRGCAVRTGRIVAVRDVVRTEPPTAARTRIIVVRTIRAQRPAAATRAAPSRLFAVATFATRRHARSTLIRAPSARGSRSTFRASPSVTPIACPCRSARR